MSVTRRTGPQSKHNGMVSMAKPASSSLPVVGQVKMIGDLNENTAGIHAHVYTCVLALPRTFC